MPITDIVVLCVIASGFLIFAIALAWGDRQTREIARESRQRALTGAQVTSIKRGAQAETLERKAGAAAKTQADV